MVLRPFNPQEPTQAGDVSRQIVWRQAMVEAHMPRESSALLRSGASLGPGRSPSTKTA